MGAATFRVKTSLLRAESANYRRYRNTLYTVQASIESARRILLTMPGSTVQVGHRLNQIQREMGNCAKHASEMAASLEQIAEIYVNTEKRLTGSLECQHNKVSNSGQREVEGHRKDTLLEKFWNWVCGIFGWERNKDHYEIDSIVFDEDGSYGGDQGAPAKDRLNSKAIYNIVRSHFPDMTDKEIAAYLVKLNSEGCGYVAAINTMFASYEGREQEFEQTFGFPMYKNGDLNYNELLVDFYCETDNHQSILGRDWVNPNEDESEVEGAGVNIRTQQYRINKYLQKRGVEIRMQSKKVTVDNFHKYAEDGYVILNYYNGPIQYENGTMAQNITGHSMTVTGVTDDGRFIVSSWGDKYYIDPSKGECYFLYIQYE